LKDYSHIVRVVCVSLSLCLCVLLCISARLSPHRSYCERLSLSFYVCVFCARMQDDPHIVRARSLCVLHMYAYVFVGACVFVGLCARTCGVCACACVCMYMREACTCTCACVCMCVCVCVRVCCVRTFVCACAFVCVYAYTYACACACACVCVFLYVSVSGCVVRGEGGRFFYDGGAS